MQPYSASQKQFVKFTPKSKSGFYDTVKERVKAYFQNNHIIKNANTKMRIKTLVMISLYVVPYLVMVCGLAAHNTWFFISLWFIMGWGIVGIGASIMHDSNHGAYSTSKTTNYFLGSLLNYVGGYSLNWRIQHNILHHTYTNLHGLDEDIDASMLIRLSPHKKRLAIHKYQYIYAWFLYALMNLFWITVKDYRNLIRYKKANLLKKERISFGKAIFLLTLYKVLYFAYILVLPILFSGMPWYWVLAGFVLMHLICGLALACIFQPAHVLEHSEYPMAQEGKIENNWALHQMLNTTDFSPKSKVLSWFIGGLNYQIEHHLFPEICHVHYPGIAPIVKKTAEEYGIPYHVIPTFAGALIAHGKMLKFLGTPESDNFVAI